MKKVHCYLMNAQLITTRGLSQGEAPQILLKYVKEDEFGKQIDGIIYVTDVIENKYDLIESIVKSLNDNSIIDASAEGLIDVNNGETTITYLHGLWKELS